MIRKYKIVILIILALLALLIYLVLNSTRVQTYVVSKLIKPIERKAQMKIDFEESGFNLTKGFQLEGLNVEDLNHDPLVRIGSLSVSPKETLWALLRSRFDFDKVLLEDLDLYYTHLTGAENSNWEQLLQSLATEDKEEPSKPLDLSLNSVSINNVQLHVNEENKQRSLEVYFASLDIDINELDFTSSTFDIESILLREPIVDLVDCGYKENQIEKKSEETVVDNNITDKPNTLPSVLLGRLEILSGSFSKRGMSADMTDTYVVINGINIRLDDVNFVSLDSLALEVENVSFSHSNGFVLDHFGADRLYAGNGKIIIDQLSVETPNSSIDIAGRLDHTSGNLDFSDLNGFIADLDIAKSAISLADVAPWSDEMASQKWFQKFKSEKVLLKTKLKGDIKDLNLLKSEITIGDFFIYNGDANVSNLDDPDNTLINFEIDRGNLDIARLNQKHAWLKLPEEIVRLGQVNVQGFFNGFADNFVTSAEVVTALGNATLDVNFDIGGENQYSGFVELNSFDLGELFGEPDLGSVTLTADISEGTGLELSDIAAVMQAELKQIEYKGYTYRNGIFNGKMSNEFIDGYFTMQNEEIQFFFNGNIDLGAAVPEYDFEVDLNKVDLCAINLAEFPCTVEMSADIDMYGKDLNSLQGTINVDSVFMTKDDRHLFIEYLDVESSKVPQGMLFDLASNEIDAKVRGIFNLTEMHKVLLTLLINDYPDIAKRLNVTPLVGLDGNENFDFSIDIKDMKDVFEFVQLKDVKNIEGEMRGRWTLDKGLSTNSFNFAHLDLNGVNLKDVLFNLDSEKGQGNFKLFIDEIEAGGRILEGFELTTMMHESEILFKIENDKNQENRIELSGRGEPWGEGYKVSIDNQNIYIDSTLWVLNEEAVIGFKKGIIQIDDFELKGGEKTIVIKDIDQKGIFVGIDGFPLEFINPIVDYDKMYFEGATSIEIRAEDLIKDRKIGVDISVPDFTINGDDYGQISIKAQENNKEIIDLSIKIEKDTQSLDLLGFIDLKDDRINADISIDDYPMSIFEYIIDEGISGTIGTTDINARIYGELSDLKLQGKGIIKNGGTRIDYIGEFYRMEDQVITINESLVNLTGVELIDSRNNVATITGGLNHVFLADFEADLSIASKDFVGLNTTEDDNPLYYGTAMGDMKVSFIGPFSTIDIKVDAIAGAGSKLNIPLENSVYGLDKGFVNFDYKAPDVDTSSQVDEIINALRLSGANFEMNLSFTREADVFVIFDESVNEVLHAKGTGDLRTIVKRDGTFEVFGDYNVESGQYLYSAYGFIAKPFEIKRGGTVRWTGDPYNAVLDVEADYSGLRAPLDVFLSEFLLSASENVKSESKNRTTVGLTLLLGGTLFQPNVNFDIAFPDVSGELKTYTDNKMRALRSTENGINNQVFGLFVFNNFLPSNNPLASVSGNTIGQTGNNTITEFFSSQLSVLVSEYISKQIKEDFFISDIDFDIALSQNTSFLQGQSENLIGGLVDIVPDQYSVNVRPTFKNDKFALNFGTDYVRESDLNNANYLTGDFALDWFITDDRRLKLRFYGDFDYDEAVAQRKQKYGFGINYQREFGRLSKFADSLDKIAKEIKDSVKNGSN